MKKFLLLNPKDYGFALDVYLNIVIILVFAALCIACFVINKNQSSIALILRKLLRAEAYGEENAKTLSELGLSSCEGVKKLLFKTSGYMKGIVTYIGAKNLSYDDFLALTRTKKKKQYSKRSENKEENKDENAVLLALEFSSAKFYIPEDKKDLAERAFAKNNGSLTKTVLSCAALIGFMLILIFTMPAILKLLASLLS